MQKNDRIFVDGLHTVKVSDGVVFLEFYNNAGTTKEPVVDPCGKIVMTRQAFLSAFSAMEEVVGQMVKAGIVKRRTEEQQPKGSTEKQPQAGSKEPVSPNFQ